MHKKFTLVIPKSCINFTTSKYIAKKFCIKKKMYNFKNTKKMKKLVFGLIATMLLGTMSFGQTSNQVYSNSSLRTGDKIGYIEKGNFVLSFDKENLLKEFSIIAKEQGLNLKYNRVEIANANPDENKKFYGLFAYSEDGTTVTAIGLDLNNNVFTISMKGGTISCSSTSCTGFGCSAYDAGQYWTCSSCTKPCNKVTTVVIKAHLSQD